MDLSLNWDSFKSIVVDKRLFIQYVDLNNKYYVYASDEPFIYLVTVDKGTTEATDFDENFKSEANRPMTVSPSASQSQFIGKKLELAAEATTGYVEWVFDHGMYLHKMMPVPIDAEFGDYVEMTLHLVENDYQVTQYGYTIYLSGNNPREWFVGMGAGYIPYGVKVRCTYNKAAGTARQFIIIGGFLK
jgi:5-hydroxyisourate hydrolase-like protein (transthyretin family)